MQVPARITFLNMETSPALEKRIAEKIDKLELSYKIISCQVVVESERHRQHQGALYSVRVDITLPGGEFVVSHDPGGGKKPKRHEEAYAAMNDAFLAIEKQMQHFKHVQKQDTKRHEPVMKVGFVKELNKSKGFGFIDASDGQVVYFHQNSVDSERFKDLKVGEKVRFSVNEGEGEKGPQANVVHASTLAKAFK